MAQAPRRGRPLRDTRRRPPFRGRLRQPAGLHEEPRSGVPVVGSPSVGPAPPSPCRQQALAGERLALAPSSPRRAASRAGRFVPNRGNERDRDSPDGFPGLPRASGGNRNYSARIMPPSTNTACPVR